jgi:hypothetical protein
MWTLEPLAKIASTAFPYWLIAAVLLTLLVAFTARRADEPLAFVAIGQFGATCGFIFVALGWYVQLSGDAMSFTQLLPSSFVVAMIFSAAILAVRPKTKTEVGMKVLGFVLGTVIFGFFLAFLLSFFPKVIAFQWNLMKKIL